MPHHGQTGITIDSSGYRLLGTLFLAPGDEPKPTSLLLHGIPGIEKNYDLAQSLRDNGRNALIFHYRGCWGSAGSYHIPTIPADVIAAIDELVTGSHPQIDPEKITLIGHSLGGWAAVLAGAADPRVKGVAAIASVTDPAYFNLGLAEEAGYYTPWLSGVTPEALASQWASLGPVHNPLRCAAAISPRPLLVVHSAADEAVEVRNGRELAAAAGETCEYIEHETANHAFSWHRPWLRARILEWLDRHHL